MPRLTSLATDGRLRVLCLGAHSDDIEIGCGGTLLQLFEQIPNVHVIWAVFSAVGERQDEAQRSAESILEAAASRRIFLGGLPDAHFPSDFMRAKNFAARLSREFDVDLVFTHRIEDRHQDHRLVAELTWQIWRNQLILEYEIPKYEGDLGQPNVFVPLSAEQHLHKVQHLMSNFGSQRSKSWFRPETFDALMRLRGIECRAGSGFAEAFHARKLVF